MKRSLVNLSRNLRNNSTNAEVRLWCFLKNKQLEGLKFRRQAPIGNYIADFVCFEKRLVIELDGGHHAEEKNIKKDAKRDNWLQEQGFQVLRIWNTDIFQNMEGVGEKILELCDKSPSP